MNYPKLYKHLHANLNINFNLYLENDENSALNALRTYDFLDIQNRKN